MKRKEIIDGQKHCARCDTWKPVGEFHRNSRNWDGLHAYCKPCMATGARARYRENRERILAQGRDYRRANPRQRKDTRLRGRFGISVEEYEAMLAAQGGMCAVCRREADPLHVDHCHSGGGVRGLLCLHCNTALGAFEDSVGRLQRAIEYLGGRE
jgi:hypothetical protein